MTDYRVPNGSQESSAPPDARWIPALLRHLLVAVSTHAHRLQQDGRVLPGQVEDLLIFLRLGVRICQDMPHSAEGAEVGHYAPVPERLLITKAEAAERLGVSLRTVDRLAAAGHLPLVHVERLARFRVKDLEAYVNGLADTPGPS
jgi:excisionase family DNA binding protein